MAEQVRKNYPAIKGLWWHRDSFYSFFIPNNWHRLPWPDGRDGVIYCPDPNDPLTVFAVDMQDLGTTVTPADLDALSEGFFESIEQLPEVDIEIREQKVMGKLFELQAKYTFREENEIRKRWARVFYDQTRQIAMTAQGATHEKYNYWLPWFFEAMMTAKIHRSKPKSVFDA